MTLQSFSNKNDINIYTNKFNNNFYNFIKTYPHKNWAWHLLSGNPNITIDIIEDNINDNAE